VKQGSRVEKNRQGRNAPSSTEWWPFGGGLRYRNVAKELGVQESNRGGVWLYFQKKEGHTLEMGLGGGSGIFIVNGRKESEVEKQGRRFESKMKPVEGSAHDRVMPMRGKEILTMQHGKPHRRGPLPVGGDLLERFL